jgi:hypothetical protein
MHACMHSDLAEVQEVLLTLPAHPLCALCAAQVLDARDPLACRCTDVERYIRQTNPNKRVILLLNKMGE